MSLSPNKPNLLELTLNVYPTNPAELLLNLVPALILAAIGIWTGAGIRPVKLSFHGLIVGLTSWTDSLKRLGNELPNL